MAEIDGNNLREEEQSGFQPGTPDDESFLLEDKEEYPGELPEGASSVKDTAEELTTAGDMKIGGIQVTEAEQIDVPKEGTVWDLFDDKKSQAEEDVSPETLAPEEKPAEIETVSAETSEPIPPPEHFEPEKEEELLSPDKLTTETDEENIPGREKESDEAEQPPEEPVKIDDDLAAIIQEDLQKAKKRAEKVEAPKPEEQPAVKPTDEEMQSKLEQFKPVEEKGDTDMIDLMQVGAGEPAISEIEDAKTVEEIVEEAPPAAVEVPAAEEKIEPVKKEEEKKEEEKERKKIIIPWKKIAIPAAAVILLAAIGIGGYYILWDKIFPPKEKKPAMAEVKQKPKVIKKEEPPMVVPKMDSTAAIPKEPDVSVTALDIAEKESKKPKPVIAEKKKPVIVEKPKPVVVEKPKLAVVEKPKPVEVKPIPNVVEKPKEKPVIASNEKKTETKPAIFPSEKKNVFTVQVYTSPSKDDAEDWMKILKRKNINGFISTQKMRDKVWYRVRFGFYDTREEARAAAEKLGFDQVWIDQIR